MIPPPNRFAAPPANRLARIGRSTPGWWRPLALLTAAAGLTLFVVHRPTRSALPDFSALEDTAARKQAFIDHLVPIVRKVNREFETPRRRLQAIDDTLAAGWPIDDTQRGFVLNVAARHGIATSGDIDRPLIASLLNHVDIVPVSLVIAQAALESGWGTSRFAREGNALFGLRCYTPGCGIVPAERPAGSTYEVAAYPDAQAAVRAYIMNLNTHPGHQGFRRIRGELRAQGAPLTGDALADGLLRYSELGPDYVELLHTVIRDNNLGRFDD